MEKKGSYLKYLNIGICVVREFRHWAQYSAYYTNLHITGPYSEPSILHKYNNYFRPYGK